jgi:hypothetical protein
VEEYPPNVAYARIIDSVWPGAFLFLDIVVVLILSYVSAGLSGLILFRKWKPYARLGFANLATIVAINVAIGRSLRSQRQLANCETGSAPSGQLSLREETDIRRETKRFLWLFTLFFVVGTILLQILLRWPLARAI